MDCKDMEQLMQRYWRCETSLQEEEALRRCFETHRQLPPELEQYRPLFEGFQAWSREHLTEEFDQKLMQRTGLQPVVVKARRRHTALGLRPFCRAAAAVAVIIGLGWMAQQTLTAPDGQPAATAGVDRHINAPSVAQSAAGCKEVARLPQDSLKPDAKPRLTPANPSNQPLQ